MLHTCACECVPERYDRTKKYPISDKFIITTAITIITIATTITITITTTITYHYYLLLLLTTITITTTITLLPLLLNKETRYGEV